LVYENKIDTWDYQWFYHCIVESKYCITPVYNMISNIGVQGTRGSYSSPFIKMLKKEIEYTRHLKGPAYICHSFQLDKIQYFNIFYRFNRFNFNYFRRLFKIDSILIKIKLWL